MFELAGGVMNSRTLILPSVTRLIKTPRGLDTIRDSRITSGDGFWNASQSHSTSEVGRGFVSTATPSVAQEEKFIAKRGGFEIADFETNAARMGTSSISTTRLCANRNRKNHSCLMPITTVATIDAPPTNPTAATSRSDAGRCAEGLSFGGGNCCYT